MINKERLQEINITDYPIIESDKLEQVFNDTIVPMLSSHGKDFIVDSATGHHLNGMIFTADNPQGTIMISHGFTESWIKFRELIYYFLTSGMNVCIYSHWNHGDSRDEAPNGRPTHIDRFQSYVDDLESVVTNILIKMPAPYYLYCHSMGGLIGSLYLEQHPGTFQKAVLSAPMHEINRGNLPYFVAKGTAALLCLVGKGKEYLPGQNPFSDIEDFENSASNCRERYLIYYREQIANPNLQNGGCSNRWALESFLNSETALKADNCRKIKIPILLFQAELDTFVMPGGQERFISNVPDGRLIFVADAKHEIYLSNDNILKKYIAVIMNFLKD